MNNPSNERIGLIIGRLEHAANNVKWSDASVAQELLQAAAGLRELLAYREAQGKPVGYTWDRGINCEIVAADLYDNCPAGIDLYAAPPLPAVPDERAEFESFMSERFGDLIDIRRAKNGDQGYMAWDVVVAWIVWQKRAMLAAAPKPGGNNG